MDAIYTIVNEDAQMCFILNDWIKNNIKYPHVGWSIQTIWILQVKSWDGKNDFCQYKHEADSRKYEKDNQA